MTSLFMPSLSLRVGGPNYGNTAVALDADSDKIACVFVAPKSGDIDRIGVYVTAVTGTVTDTYAVRLETVGTDLWPSGTLAGGSAEQVINAGSNLVANTWYETTLTTPATVTAGTYYAAVVTDASGQSPSGTDYATFRTQSGQTNYHVPVAAGNIDGAGWSIGAGYPPSICPMYSDNAKVIGTHAVVGSNGVAVATFNSASTPDEYGCQFTPDWNCDCVGIAAGIRESTSVTNGDIASVRFYLASNGTPLESFTVRAESLTASTGLALVQFPARAITAGTDYIVSVKALDATNSLRAIQAEYASAAYNAVNNGPLYKVTRSDTGSWTTDTASIVDIAPILTNVSVGGAAGMKRIAGMLGGMRG